MMTQLFPSDVFWSIPKYPHPGAFGGPRTHDLHTGVDLYVPEGTPVYAIASGTVVDVSVFTGPNANPPCPWWNETYAVTIYHPSLKAYILYGEIIPFHFPSPTERVFIHKGDLIGQVLRVLKKDKGKPMSMLHLEAYVKDPIGPHPYWKHGEPVPDGLVDPSIYLKESFLIDDRGECTWP